MKLKIKLTSNDAFQILEQDTGFNRYHSQAIYEDEDIAIFQRNTPDYNPNYCDSSMMYSKHVLYLRGAWSSNDFDTIVCCDDLLFVISKLKKAFSDFSAEGKYFFPTKRHVPICSSPVRYCCIATTVQLACFRPAASVRSEPGSNSHIYYKSRPVHQLLSLKSS